MRRLFEKLLFVLVLLSAFIGGNALALSEQDKRLIDKPVSYTHLRAHET